jgi:hypothetical protein
MATVSIPLWLLFQVQRPAPELGVLRGARAALGGRCRVRLGVRHDLARPVRDGGAPGGRAPADAIPAAETGAALDRAPLGDGGGRGLRGGAAATARGGAPWTFGFVWLGFVLLLDPLNGWAGRPSFLAAWRAGDRAFVWRWLVAGLVCAFLWEFWNYWALAKWRYVGVPVFPSIRLFEMPLAAYLGFPPFALEVFAMYHLVRPLARLEPEVGRGSGD